MATAPSISIVINNYNYEAFLAQAIESALAQAWTNTEVIVVDDGSTDGSRAVIRHFETRVRPVLKQNGGQGSAFNAGFAASKGDIVCFLDADDRLLPDAMARAADALAPASVIKAHWRLAIIGREGKRTGGFFPPQPMPAGSVLETALRDGPFYDSAWLPPTSGNVWRRSFLTQVLPMPEAEFDHGADVYLHGLAPLFGSFAALEETLGEYRAHGANHYWSSGLSDRKLDEYIARFESTAKALARFVRERGLSADPADWRRRNFNYLWLTRLRDARDWLRSHVTADAQLVLVGGEEWGTDKGLPGMRVRSFLERDGEWYGVAPDDEAAIAALESMRDEGATQIAFWWTSFWWLQQFPNFAAHLRSSYRCLKEDTGLIVFDLAQAVQR